MSLDKHEITINGRIVQTLVKKGLQQKGLASAIGVSTSTLNNWLKLNRNIPSDFLIPICEYIGVELNWLLTGNDVSGTKTPQDIGNIVPHMGIDERFPNKIGNRVPPMGLAARFPDKIKGVQPMGLPSDWQALTKDEQHIIGNYRLMDDESQRQLSNYSAYLLVNNEANAPPPPNTNNSLETKKGVSNTVQASPQHHDAPRFIEMKVYEQSAAAGFGNYLNEGESYEMLSFDESTIPARADFGIRISGDSMEPLIQDSDIAWVEAGPEVENGDIGIFVYQNESYCKKLKIDLENRRIQLISLNEAYSPITIHQYEELWTIGKVLR